MVKRSRGPEAITQMFSLRKSYFAMLLRPELMKEILMLQNQTNKMHTEMRDSLVKRNILHYFLLKPVVRHMCVQCKTLGVWACK